MKNHKISIIWGLAFIILGILLLGNAIEIWSFDLFFDGWWTLFIIVPSIVGLFTDNSKSGSIIFLIIGVLLLLNAQDILTFTAAWKIFFASAILIVGISILYNSLISPKTKEIKVKKRTDCPDYNGIFGGVTEKYNDEEFKGCNITSVFGSVELDLRNAIIKEDAVITAVAVFGGIDIFLPDGVNIKTAGTNIFGGVENKNKSNEPKKGKTIYINTVCVFGGVDLK